ncbi:hypothetical protein K474DRAFT_914436 [Panus rudis PR-1116 ss-1]|nr:hypothetical protein K474DRAFT_914436 [Panus rudis PR-1116 ss-1]
MVSARLKRTVSLSSLSSLTSTGSSSSSASASPAPSSQFESSSMEVERAITIRIPPLPHKTKDRRLDRDRRPAKRRKTMPEASPTSTSRNKQSRARETRRSLPVAPANPRSDIESEDGQSVDYGHTPVGQCLWPPKLGLMDFGSSSIGCDGCGAWYHVGCVGISQGDKRLDPDAQYHCPPCEASLKRKGTTQKLSVVREEYCARPDCEKPRLLGDDAFYVERIIGRRPYKGNAAEHGFEWLIKWEGWKVVDATWVPTADFPAASEHIQLFQQCAESQGLRLESQHITLLLREARAGGWC